MSTLSPSYSPGPHVLKLNAPVLLCQCGQAALHVPSKFDPHLIDSFLVALSSVFNKIPGTLLSQRGLTSPSLASSNHVNPRGSESIPYASARMDSSESSTNSSYQLRTHSHGARRRRTPLPASELESPSFYVDIETATGRPPLVRRHSDHNLHFDLDLDTMPRETESRFCWQYFFLKGCAVAYVLVMLWIFSPLVSLILYGSPDLHPDAPAWILNYKHDPQYVSQRSSNPYP